MTPEAFRAEGYRMIDTIAEYMRTIETRRVTPDAPPGTVLDALATAAPEDPHTWDAIHDDLQQQIIPHLTHWQHPGFFAYFPCSASGPGILGEIASAGLNVNGMLWSTSPAATELETRVLDWCREAFGLPDAFAGNGVIQGTASEATLVALLAARARHPGEDLHLLTSAHAHSSIMKAAMIAGLADGPDDTRRVHLIETDASGAMDPSSLRARVERLLADGAPPMMVAACVGTTGTGGIDDIPAIRVVMNDLHRAHHGEDWKGWLHIDAAWAGVAAVCDEHRDLFAGAALADSVCTNPHKWLLTNFDCDLFWVRDREALIRALSITPEYLRNQATDSGGVIDYRDWQIPLGRRFRALKLWFVVRHYGLTGLRAHIRRHIAWAEWFEESIAADPRLELVCARSLSLVCFRVRDTDDATNRAVLEAINATGEVFLSHAAAPGDGRYMIRFVPGATSAAFHHVVRAREIIAAAVDAVAR